jgi:hypothetical protein
VKSPSRGHGIAEIKMGQTSPNSITIRVNVPRIPNSSHTPPDMPDHANKDYDTEVCEKVSEISKLGDSDQTEK